MKLKIFMMLVILGILSVMPMIYMGEFDPMAYFDSGISKGVTEFKKLKAKAPKSLSSVVSDDKVQVYKWRDKNGVMQFGSTPPPEVRNAQQMTVDPNHNLVQAVKIPVKEEEKAATQTEVATPNPYTVKGMKKVMDDARGVEDLLKKRSEQQQKQMNNL